MNINDDDYKQYLRDRVTIDTSNAARECFNIGWDYYSGGSVCKDNKKAMHWLKKAADMGLAEAQHEVASMYYHKEGVPEDKKEILKWLRKAAKQGYKPSKECLKDYTASLFSGEIK